MSATAYPLYWPFGLPRAADKARSLFKTSTSAAVANVQNELRLFAKDTDKPVEFVVISSNVTLMEPKPEDPGVAVYFMWDNMEGCIAVDRYGTPAENLQAITKIIEAERVKMRHGGLNIVRAGFRGYVTLPPPMGKISPPWRQVLGVDKKALLPEIEEKYRVLVKAFHPDRPGGDSSKFNAIVEAMRQAREELRT